MNSTLRGVLAVSSIAVGALSFAPAAIADRSGPQFNCRASAVFASVSGGNRVEPVVANGNPNTAAGINPDFLFCGNGNAGADNLATPLGVPTDILRAQSLSAITGVDAPSGATIDEKIASWAKVEKLTVPLGTGDTILGVTAANAFATASCVGGVPKLEGASTLAGVTLGGQDIVLDEGLTALTEALAPLAPLVEIKVNERIQDATSLTVRALHVKLLSAAGTEPLVDLIVAESKVAAAPGVCQSLTNRVAGTTTQGSKEIKPCPSGAVLDLDSELCVIRATNTHGLIVIGRPFQGPSGGTVVALVDARKLYTSECLKGAGPQYAIIGTNGADRITGTNKRDRILGRGGNDAIDGGRSDDCLDGGVGGDNLNGAIGNDRVFGLSGKDHLNGGPGRDYLSAGTGNDTINAAFGADRVFGGAGNDFINVATAGRRATVHCGSGRDKVRFNQNERRSLHNCEIRYPQMDSRRD